TAGKAGKGRVDEIGLPDRERARALLLRDLAELGVVHQHVTDIHAVFDRGGELHRVLTKAAVARDRDDLAVAILRPVLRRRPRAHGRWKAESDRPQIARHQHALLAGGLKIATERISVVADVNGEDRILRRVPRQRLEQRRCGDALAAILIQARRLLRAPQPPTLSDRKSHDLDAGRGSSGAVFARPTPWP